jgi:hypothetical protein
MLNRQKYLLFALLVCCQSVFSQSDTAVYVKEMALAIKLPSGFHVIDTATLYAESRAREKEIHWVRKPKPTDTNFHKLLLWARTDAGDVIHINSIDSVRDPLGLNFTQFEMSIGESTTSYEVYGGVKFHQLRKKMNTYPHPYINTILKTFYEGKIFSIDCAIEPSREGEVETMLTELKFNR